MTHDVSSFFQNVLLVGHLPWIIVVNDIGHSIFISSVGHDADMSFEDYNIATLPCFYFWDICGQGNCCVWKKYIQVSPAGSLCLHPARLPYNLVGVPGYPRPQALVDHIRHISTHKPLHQCTLRNYRQDNRSHSSGFCILDVYSHRPVHRSEYLTGHLHRHHPDPRYYEAAVSCPYNRPPAWLPRYAGNVSAHKYNTAKYKKYYHYRIIHCWIFACHVRTHILTPFCSENTSF